MMGEHFRIVDEGYNLLHIGRTSLATPDLHAYRRYLNLNGTAMDPAVPTVPHLKAWTRGKALVEKAVHRALRERLVDTDPYISQLLRGRFCARDKKRPVMRPPEPPTVARPQRHHRRRRLQS